MADFKVALTATESIPDFQYRRRSAKFWREAWAAFQFALRTNQLDAELRLTPEGCSEGDFELRSAGGPKLYEIVEVVDPAMIRALKEATEPCIYHETEDAVSGAFARREISRLIAQKASKCYPAGIGLVIYVNAWTDFERKGIAGLLSERPHAFDSIWLLADGEALKLA